MGSYVQSKNEIQKRIKKGVVREGQPNPKSVSKRVVGRKSKGSRIEETERNVSSKPGTLL